MIKNDENQAAYYFHQGTNYRAYEYFGVHLEGDGYVFRVWTPNADEVFVVGDFNSWDNSMPMRRISDGGIYEAYDSNGRVRIGDRYKFKIIKSGREYMKADPYARECERPPQTASVVPSNEKYVWRDKGWREYSRRKANSIYELPMNIYEPK